MCEQWGMDIGADLIEQGLGSCAGCAFSDECLGLCEEDVGVAEDG